MSKSGHSLRKQSAMKTSNKFPHEAHDIKPPQMFSLTIKHGETYFYCNRSNLKAK